MNSSVYGKTKENLRKRVKVRLANNAKDYKKWIWVNTALFHRKYLVKIFFLSTKLN